MWEQCAGGGSYVAPGCRRRLLCGSIVQEEAIMWQQGAGGGHYVSAGYRRRIQEEAAMWKQGTSHSHSRLATSPSFRSAWTTTPSRR